MLLSTVLQDLVRDAVVIVSTPLIICCGCFSKELVTLALQIWIPINLVSVMMTAATSVIVVVTMRNSVSKVI